MTSTEDDPQIFWGRPNPKIDLKKKHAKTQIEEIAPNFTFNWPDRGHCFIFGFLLEGGHVRDIQPLRCSQNPWLQEWNPAMPKTRHLESPGKLWISLLSVLINGLFYNIVVYTCGLFNLRPKTACIIFLTIQK